MHGPAALHATPNDPPIHPNHDTINPPPNTHTQQHHTNTTAQTQEAQAPQQWRMALYVRQPFPDNFVPRSFLSKLVTNAGVSRPRLVPAVLGACIVAQQLSVALLFLLAFAYAHAGRLPLPWFLGLDLGLALLGSALLAALAPSPRQSGSGGCSGAGIGVGRFLLFAMGLRVLSPVLRTLTLSYSDDTIRALALALLGVHLLFHEYHAPATATTAAAASSSSSSSSPTTDQQQQHQQPELHHGTVALNAAVLAAVLLASRLPSNEAVFALTLLAVELFAFFPLARHHVRRHSTAAHVALTLALVVATGGLLLHATGLPALAALYGLTVAFVTLACPVWLRGIYARKNTIQGPWDVATVESIGGD